MLKQKNLIIVAIILAIFSLHTAVAVEHHTPNPSQNVTAMSFNIRTDTILDALTHSWGGRKKFVISVINKHQPDFAGLQEVTPYQMKYMVSELSDYTSVSRSRGKKTNSGEASPIFYNSKRWTVDQFQHGTFWLSDTPAKPGSKSWGNMFPRIVTWGRFIERDTNRIALVFNTHFSHHSKKSRLKSIQLLSKKIAQLKAAESKTKNVMVIVMGDFNAKEDSAPIHYIKGTTDNTDKTNKRSKTATASKTEIPLVDTFRLLHADAKIACTFGLWGRRKIGPKIDYVFTTPDRTIIDARIIYDNNRGKYPSDHYPIIGTIAWSQKTNANHERVVAHARTTSPNRTDQLVINNAAVADKLR